ncbi:MAG: thioredoxin family protein [Candidatus Peregrinibacteria bacterium]|nr:thioredoxin family protein [Candidatus Peregrinibacteria bacterium]
MNTKLLITAIAMGTLLIVASGCTPAEKSTDTGDGTAVVDVEEDEGMEDEAMEDEDGEEEGSDETAYGDPIYTEYNSDLYYESLGVRPVALFFHASWCPTCILMDKNITAELDSFPDGTNILMVDYDTQDTLKMIYGITSQSIVVVIDADGQVVDKLAAPSVDTLIESIERSL